MECTFFSFNELAYFFFWVTTEPWSEHSVTPPAALDRVLPTSIPEGVFYLNTRGPSPCDRAKEEDWKTTRPGYLHGLSELTK